MNNTDSMPQVAKNVTHIANISFPLAKPKRAFWEAVGLCFLDSSPNYSNWAVQFTQVY